MDDSKVIKWFSAARNNHNNPTIFNNYLFNFFQHQFAVWPDGH